MRPRLLSAGRPALPVAHRRQFRHDLPVHAVQHLLRDLDGVGVGDLDDAEAVWRDCLSALANFNATGTKPYPLSVSHGFALYDPDIEPDLSPQDIVSRADQTMYEEKTAIKAREGGKPR